MIRICSYCGKNMGEKAPYENKHITDGICDSCLEKLVENEWSVRRAYGGVNWEYRDGLD